MAIRSTLLSVDSKKSPHSFWNDVAEENFDWKSYVVKNSLIQKTFESIIQMIIINSDIDLIYFLDFYPNLIIGNLKDQWNNFIWNTKYMYVCWFLIGLYTKL